MANVCVRPSGDVANDGDGNTWAAAASGGAAGARKGLPSTLTRGDTYFIADGAYVGYNFDDVASGATVITIKKATVAAHGPATGWQDTYGDGTATFTGGLTFATDFYVVDGVTRNENDWTEQVYGFRCVNGVTAFPANFPPGGNHITVNYMDMGGEVGTGPGDPGFGVDEPVYFVSQSIILTDFTVSHCFIHNTTICRLSQVDTFVFEYCYFKDMWQKEAIRGDVTTKNGIMRYNIFKNVTQDTGLPGEGGTAPIAIWDDDLGAGSFDNNQIYGNVFWDTLGTTHSGGVVLVGGNGGSVPGVATNNSGCYNNTIAGYTGAFNADIRLLGGTGNVASNNLWYDCIGTPSVTANTAASNSEIVSDIFVNLAAGNFHLDEHTADGTDLASPYNEDMDGAIRGGDGTWDRGAFQLAGSPGLSTIGVLIVANLIIG